MEKTSEQGACEGLTTGPANAKRHAGDRTPIESYDGWYGSADSVLLALAEESGYGGDPWEIGSYLAIRVAPMDAARTVATIRGATSARLAVHRAREVRLTCVGSGEGPPWLARFDFESTSSLAPQFLKEVRNADGRVLVVVFSGPADLSEGWVTWAGVVSVV